MNEATAEKLANLPSAQDFKPLASWRYAGKTRDNFHEIGGVFYPYEMLHKGSLSGEEPRLRQAFGEQARLRVKRPFDNFDLDVAMKKACNAVQYKKTVWKELKRTKPDFLRTMTHDERVVRVKGYGRQADHMTIDVEPAQYSDQMVTNHKKAHDVRVNDVEAPGASYTVGQLAFEKKDKKRLLPFDNSPFSNTIGISCVVRTTEGCWVICRRASKLAHEAGSWGTSASGALAWSEPDAWNGKHQEFSAGDWYEVDFDRWVKEGLAHECEQEIGWRPENPEWFTYLGFAREWGRLGKPQFFFLVDMLNRDGGLDNKQLEVKWAVYASAGEHVELRFLDDREARVLVGDETDEIQGIIGGDMLSEELRLNLALALEMT